MKNIDIPGRLVRRRGALREKACRQHKRTGQKDFGEWVVNRTSAGSVVNKEPNPCGKAEGKRSRDKCGLGVVARGVAGNGFAKRVGLKRDNYPGVWNGRSPGGES